jgi:hypothetical protein
MYMFVCVPVYIYIYIAAICIDHKFVFTSLTNLAWSGTLSSAFFTYRVLTASSENIQNNYVTTLPHQSLHFKRILFL